MLALIEQAIKDKLSEAINDKNGKYHGWVREVKSYGGDFDEDDFAQVVRQFPAIWVTFKKSTKPVRKGAKKRQRGYEFTILVGANSGRAEQASRLGAFNAKGKLLNVGSYQLVHLVMDALDGKELPSLESHTTAMEAGDVNTIFNTKTNNEVVSVLSIDFTTTHTYMQGGHDEEYDSLPWLERVEIRYQDYVVNEDTGLMEALDIAHDDINLTID